MSRPVRLAAALPLLGLVTALLIWGTLGLPDFGAVSSEYARLVDRITVPRRQVTNIVSAVMFDFRGLDTMIEEFILFAAVMGVVLLLRSTREVAEQRPHDLVTSDAVRLPGGAMAAVTLLWGLWVISFGYITPGGGFQGGVAASTGALLLWLAGSYRDFQSLTPTTLVDGAEGLGAAAYGLVGFAGIGAGVAFLANVLPLGTAGTLTSGGTIALLNWVAGAEVAAALVLLYHEFLEEYIQTFGGTTEET